MFRSSLLQHQGAYYRQHFQNKLLQLLYTNLSTAYVVHIEEFPAVLLHEGNENVK
jgi:hypothetical protein